MRCDNTSLLLLLAAAASCGPPCVEAATGTLVCSHIELDVEAYAAAVEAAIDGAELYDSRVGVGDDRPVIDVVGERWQCEGGTCRGWFSGDNIRIAVEPCVADTSLAHEVLHWAYWCANVLEPTPRGYDPATILPPEGHDRGLYYAHNSVEAEANDSVRHLCR